MEKVVVIDFDDEDNFVFKSKKTNIEELDKFRNRLSKDNNTNFRIGKFPLNIASINNEKAFLYTSAESFKRLNIFKIDLTLDIFEKGDILYINNNNSIQVEVIKVYNQWWRKILRYIGFNIKTFDGILVKVI